MKKRIGIFAVTLATCVTVGLSGCSKGGVNVANLNSNWFAYTMGDIIQPTFIEDNDNFQSEEIVYDVTFTPEQNSLGYTLSYDKGTYTTTFKAVKLSTETLETITDTEYNRAEYTEKLEAVGGVTAYYYETNYAISGKFTVSDMEDKFNDSTVTKCYFLSVGEKLRPLYSYRAIKSTSPSNKGVYKKIDVVYECFYKFDGSAVKSYTTDNLAEGKITEKTQSLGGAANTLFDVAAFNIAVRATNLSAGTGLSQAISAYSTPDGIGNFTVKGSDKALVLDKDNDKNKTALAELTDKMTAAGLFVPEPPKDDEPAKELSTVAVDITYNGDLSGVSQTYWFTAVSNPYNNTGRATMLKVSSPLPFGLGTLDFTLSNITSTLWNK